METAALLVVLVILLALFFDFTNGFHDTANAMATPIATGALKPKTAVLLAAVLNLVGAFLSTEVSKTVSHGIIHEDGIQAAVFLPMIFAGLIGAITWNMLTWLLGLPSSSSHALFGGLIGATLVGVGVQGIDFGMVLSKIILPALIAPVTAGIIAFVATKAAYSITRRYDGKPDGRDGFRWGQIFTSSLVALAHGTNDAQKTMGVITLALITVGWQNADQADPYLWVIIACAVTIALGTYLGGWRIIRTLGKGLTDVKPAQGFSAESATAATILASSAFGFALSTTQVASGSVIGSGLGRRGSTVRWRTAGRIAIGWLLTLPAAGAVGALAALIALWLGGWGIAIDAVLALAVIIGLFLRSRRDAVTPANAMSDVAESGLAIDLPDAPPPTRRQQRIEQAKAEAKARKQAKADARAQGKNGTRTKTTTAVRDEAGTEKERANERLHRLARLLPGVRRGADRRRRDRHLLRLGSAPAGAQRARSRREPRGVHGRDHGHHREGPPASREAGRQGGAQEPAHRRAEAPVARRCVRMLRPLRARGRRRHHHHRRRPLTGQGAPASHPVVGWCHARALRLRSASAGVAHDHPCQRPALPRRRRAWAGATTSTTRSRARWSPSERFTPLRQRSSSPVT